MDGSDSMQEKWISLIIPMYRNFPAVRETLECVFRQDYPWIEIVISDDGSPEWDREFPSLKAFAEERRGTNIVDIVYSHMPENKGTVANCNNGYSLGRGEYIKDLSPGDTLTDDHALSRYVELLEESGCLIGFCRILGLTPEGEIVRHLASSAEDYDVLRQMTPEQLLGRLFARNCLPAPAWFAKKELFETYGYYDTSISRLMEDYPYWIHLCLKGVKIAFWDDALIYYRLNNSGAGNYGVNFMKDLISVYDHCIFPHDHRYGALQGVYNALKRGGLNAYMDRAKWDTYTAGQKALAWLRHGIFFVYIDWQDRNMRLKNQKEQNG